MKKRISSTSWFIMMILIMFFFGNTNCDAFPLKTSFIADESKTVSAGTTWIVSEITDLTNLTIEAGAIVKAPDGYSLSMTVDGVETSIDAGSFTGNIVLTPTQEIVIPFNAMGASNEYTYRTAVYIENGSYIESKSVTSAVLKGEITNTSAKGLKLKSVGKDFNAIILRGEEPYSYSLEKPEIDLIGNGGNDFAGIGAGIMTVGKSEVTIEGATISADGAVRTAIFAGGNTTLHVNNSYIEVFNGELPADYKFSVMPGEMMEVPWMLGIIGNVRAVNITENAVAYFNNTHIKAQGWGALSTDNVANTRVYATDCIFETTESGYGAFTLGNNISYFSHCTFKVKDMALISQDGDAEFSDGTVVNSERFGVMYFGTDDYIKIKDCNFNTKSTVLLIKGEKTDITVDNSELNTGNGIILQMMENDDPFMAAMDGSNFPGPGNPPAGPGPEGPGGPGGPGKASSDKNVNAIFSNMTLKGDLVNAYTEKADMTITLDNATLTGAVTTSTAEHVLGPNNEPITMEHPELYYLIGQVNNTYSSTDNEFGAELTLNGSTWIVDKTSYLTNLTINKGSLVKAPEGYNISMMVDGVEKPLNEGNYSGKITISINKN